MQYVSFILFKKRREMTSSYLHIEGVKIYNNNNNNHNK